MNRKKDFRVRLRTKPAPCAGESVQASSDMIVAYQDESGANPHPDRSPPPVGRERSGAAAAAAAVDWGSGGGRGRGRGRAKGAGGVALHCAPLGGVAYSGVCVEWVRRRIAATRWHFTCCLRPTPYGPTLIFCGTCFFRTPVCNVITVFFWHGNVITVANPTGITQRLCLPTIF
jgi:hypothetical protein